MKIFKVRLKKRTDDSYRIVIAEDLFETLARDLAAGLVGRNSRFAVITDYRVEKLYGYRLIEALEKQHFAAELFSFPEGEAQKNRDTKAALEDRMIACGFGRDSCVIALGGGVVSDLAGFVAATYARGIPFINYATTLLAAADAAVGGKTAVDTAAATNLIGAFWQPRRVYLDLATWHTLALRDIRCGLAETIKHACLADYNFFTYLEEHVAQIISASEQSRPVPEEIYRNIAQKNCQIKYRVVQADEREANYRQVLNLGHTVGRALEPLCAYTLSHGEAVSIGLSAQLRLGLYFGYVKETEAARVESLLRTAGLPVNLPAQVSRNQLVEKMYTDKKVRKSKIRFVFQHGIGRMMRFTGGSYAREVSEEDLLNVL